MSTTRNIAKNFSWLAIGEVIGRGIGFLTVIYIARVLGAAAFGTLSFAQAFLAYLLLMVDSGLSMLGTREIAREHGQAGRLSLNVFAVRVLIAVLTFLTASVVLWFLPIPFNLKLFFGATFLFVFYHALNADWVFQGLERMEYIAFSKILFSILVFAATLFLVRSGEDLINVPLIQFAGGMFISLLFLYILFRRFVPVTFGHFAPEHWWNYFSEAIPLGASFILVQIYYNLDTIMLGFMSTTEKVGLYNAGYKLFLASVFLLGLWQSTVFPVVARMLIDDRQRAAAFLGKYIKLTLLFCIPLAFLVTLLAPALIGLFYGVGYMGSTIALQILVWNIIPLAVSGLYGTLIFIPLGKTRLVLWGAVAGAVVNIILNFMLIPFFGFSGAAAATLAAEILVAMVLFFLGRKELPLRFINYALKPILGSFFCLFMVFLTGIFFYSLKPILLYPLFGSVFVLGYLIFLYAAGEGPFLMEFLRELSIRKS